MLLIKLWKCYEIKCDFQKNKLKNYKMLQLKVNLILLGEMLQLHLLLMLKLK